MQPALSRPAVSDMGWVTAEGDQALDAIGQSMDFSDVATAAYAGGLDLALPLPIALQFTTRL